MKINFIRAGIRVEITEWFASPRQLIDQSKSAENPTRRLECATLATGRKIILHGPSRMN
jgi:hypothetical protein